MTLPETPAQGVNSRGGLSRIFFSSGEARLRTLWRLVIFGILLAVFTVVFSLPLVFINLSGFSGVLWVQAVTVLGTTAAIFTSRKVIDRRSIPSLGLHLSRDTLAHLGLGILIMGVSIGLIYLAESGLGWLQITSLAWDSQAPGKILLEILVPTLVLFILVGWVEELIFRGYLLKNLADGLNQPSALVLSSAAFALAHSLNPGVSLIAIAGLFLAGLLMGYAAIRTGNLWLPVGLHIGWNFFEGPIFGFPVSGLSFPQMLEQVVTGPDLWTGGKFGPEAGLIVIPALTLAVALIYLVTRNRSKVMDG